MSSEKTKNGVISGETVQERLAWVREQRFGRRGQAALAHALGIPPTTYAHYEKDIDLPLELAIKLVRLARVNPRWLWRGYGKPFLPDDTTIPQEKDAASTIGALLEEVASLEARLREVAVPYRPESGEIDWPAWLRKQGYTRGDVVRVEDDSMRPWLLRGSLVGIDRSANAPEYYRGARDVPVAVGGEEGRISFRLLSEMGNQIFVFLSGPGESRLKPTVWSPADRSRFPVVGRVVFVFSHYPPEEARSNGE